MQAYEKICFKYLSYRSVYNFSLEQKLRLIRKLLAQKTIFKITLIFLIHFSFAMTAFGGDSISSQNSIRLTIPALVKTNENTIKYLNKTYTNLISEKQKILQMVNFKTENYFEVNDLGGISINTSNNDFRNHVSAPITGECELNDWKIIFDVNPLKRGYSNNCGLMIPLISNKKKKALILDTLIEIEKKKSFFMITNILLQDIRRLWGMVLDIMQIEREIKIREDINTRINNLISYLLDFSKQGVISRRNVNIFELSLSENKIQISVLKTRVAYLKAQIQSTFIIEESQFNEILAENKKTLIYIADHYKNNKRINQIAESIDSLNMCAIRERRKYDATSDLNLSIGPNISSTGGVRDINFGAGAQFSVNFIMKKNSRTINLSQPEINAHIANTTDSKIDSITIDEIDKYVASIEENINYIKEDIKSGIYYTIPTLNDLFSKISNANVNKGLIYFTKLRSCVNSIQSFEDVDLQDQILAALKTKILEW